MGRRRPKLHASLSPLGLWSFHSRLSCSKRATGCHTEMAKLTTITRQRALPGEVPPHCAGSTHWSNKQTPAGFSVLSSLFCLSSLWLRTDEQGAKRSVLDTWAPLKPQVAGGRRGSRIRSTLAGRCGDRATVMTCPGSYSDPVAGV